MRVTVLVENTRLEDRGDLVVEEGLAMHIAVSGKQVLFDAGSSDAVVVNAGHLSINLNEVDAGIVSHHHFDHGDGMLHFLENNKTASLYLSDYTTRELTFRLLGLSQYIGLDRRIFDKYPKRLQFVGEKSEILPDIFLITDIHNRYPPPNGNRYLYEKKDGRHIPDRFKHEMIMVVRESGGLVVFTGCAHSGLLNMLDTVVTTFPDELIKAVMGGFHLIGIPLYDSLGASKKEIAVLGEEILGFPIEKLYTGHCTGKKGYRALKQVLGDKLIYLPAGSCVEI